jgi:hypothetical protein
VLAGWRRSARYEVTGERGEENGRSNHAHLAQRRTDNHMEPLTLLLSSTVVSTIVSGLVSGIMSVYTQRRGFAHEYHRQILSRRLTACEAFDAVLDRFKVTVSTSKGLCHRPFTAKNLYMETLVASVRVLDLSLWFSSETKGQLPARGWPHRPPDHARAVARPADGAAHPGGSPCHGPGERWVPAGPGASRRVGGPRRIRTPVSTLRGPAHRH